MATFKFPFVHFFLSDGKVARNFHDLRHGSIVQVSIFQVFVLIFSLFCWFVVLLDRKRDFGGVDDRVGVLAI